MRRPECGEQASLRLALLLLFLSLYPLLVSPFFFGFFTRHPLIHFLDPLRDVRFGR